MVDSTIVIDVPRASFSSTELRKPDVLSAAFDNPISVRVSGRDDALIVAAESFWGRTNSLLQAYELFARAVVESGREDPSSVALGPVSYVAAWGTAERTRFLRGFAEALSQALQDNDPQVVTDYIELMSRAGDPILDDGVAGRMSDKISDRVAARVERPEQTKHSAPTESRWSTRRLSD